MQGHWHSKADFASFPTTQDHSILTLGRPSTIATKKGFSEEPKMAQPSWETNLLENPMLPTHLQAWSDQHEDVQVSLKLISPSINTPLSLQLTEFKIDSLPRMWWHSRVTPSNTYTLSDSPYAMKPTHKRYAIGEAKLVIKQVLGLMLKCP